MAVKCSMYLGASLDGFIARRDGDVEWMDDPDFGPMGNEGLAYPEFIKTVDALVMGRHTFEKALTFGGWPYDGTPVVVLSRRPLEIPSHLVGKVTHDAGEPRDIVRRMESAGRRHLYVDGGVTVQRFLRAGLISEITITTLPIVLGDGIPLFGSVGVEVKLDHLETTTYANGFVQVRYRVRGATGTQPDDARSVDQSTEDGAE